MGAIATVAGDTTEPVPPDGTVQFYLDGQKVGRPERLDRGRAFLPLFGGGGGSVTAVYGGDNYYNGSSSQAASVS